MIVGAGLGRTALMWEYEHRIETAASREAIYQLYIAMRISQTPWQR